MKFVNHAARLRKRVQDWPGVYEVNAPTLWEEMANINEGIAELLASAIETEGGDAQQAPSRSDESATAESGYAQ